MIYVEANSIVSKKLGGENVEVQMDEAAIGKAKYNRGKGLKRRIQWVVGAIDKANHRVAVRFVEKRDQNTLLQFALDTIQKGSKVYTDEWKAYCSLSAHSFKHKTVNHSKNFKVISDNGEVVHTNNIESLWRTMRDFLQIHHYRKRELMDSYVCEWAARFNNHNPSVPKISSMFGVCTVKNVRLFEQQNKEKEEIEEVEIKVNEKTEQKEKVDSIASRLLQRRASIRKFMGKKN